MFGSPTFELPKLYGISSTGKVKEWKISVRWLDNTPNIVTEYGYVDGEIQSTEEEIKKGKNIGRSNETTPFEQACLEAKSKWRKQQDHGYHETIPTFNDVVHLPMLAQKYENKSHIVRWPWYGQPKFNGVRCVATIVDNNVLFTSRNGKQYNTLAHLKSELLSTFGHLQPIVLDGELYHPQLSLQDIVARVKREKTSRLELETVKLQYWIYDVVNILSPFTERLQLLSKALPDLYSTEYLSPVETPLLANEHDLITFNEYNLERGFEGSMLRNPNGLYVPHYRSSDLLKYKVATFKDDEFRIIGGVSAKGKDTGTVVFICTTADGKEFSVRPKGTVEQRTRWLNNIDRIVGKLLTVRYAELTPDGIPFHPTGVIIRDYE